jgi:hypothetical protein
MNEPVIHINNQLINTNIFTFFLFHKSLALPLHFCSLEPKQITHIQVLFLVSPFRYIQVRIFDIRSAFLKADLLMELWNIITYGN